MCGSGTKPKTVMPSNQPGPPALADPQKGLRGSGNVRKGGRVPRLAGLHPAEPPAKRLYHKVARPSGDSRGMRSSQSVPEPHARSPPCSGLGCWSPEQLQQLAAKTLSSSSSSVHGLASASRAGRWRPKRPTHGQGSKPRDRQSRPPAPCQQSGPTLSRKTQDRDVRLGLTARATGPFPAGPPPVGPPSSLPRASAMTAPA